jgi:putative redox protein
MVQPRADTLQTYALTVRREDAARAVAEARGHQITLNIKKGDGAAGFNAAETLLAALGACLLTNVNSLSQKMRLQIDDARMEITSLRRDEPPGLIQIDYRLILDSPEPAEKLQELHALCVKWGTVTNTLIDGLTPHGEVIVERKTVTTQPASLRASFAKQSR